MSVPQVPQRIPSDTSDSDNARVLVHPNRWLLLIILGFGFTTWAAFLYLGIRARHRAWLAWAAVYAVVLVVSGVMDSQAHPSSTASSVGAIALLIAWVGGAAHAAAIRKDAARRVRHPGSIARLDAARQRIERRAEGRSLAARDPRLAREVGVGRPDVPGADDYGLVDVNHASQDALSRLPGITPEIAQRIVDTRDDIGSFKSAEDLGISLNLPPQLVDEINEYSVFL
jgi:DNA uptake protein ComE-like DNA-binding protein